MNVLSGLEPKNVFHFFEQICAIPHGSYHTKAISDYLVAFAKERGLKYRQDEANNVIIWKGATPGYENAPTVMLQGHMDMVCEKDPDCAKDMETESLDLFVDGDEVGARGTTLGGDDGIAVAMGLAILDADDIAHGPLECLFTVDEEVGMIGARALDASDLKAKYMINIDSVDGLIGGHSGEEIHKGRANSNILMGRALYELSEKTEVRIVDVRGGTKDNAIPRDASAVITVANAAAAQRVVTELDAALKGEFHTADSGVSVRLSPAEAAGPALDADSTRRVICFLFCAPNGVQMMSADVPGLVQTSLNLGQVFSEEDKVTARFMVRSSVNSQKDETTERVAALTKALGGSIEIPASYSAWEYRPDSPLRDVTVEAFRAVYGEEPTIAALHAGLECGILSGKMPELDCISFGPDLTNIHTPQERLHIASTRRVWQLTLETLKRIR